MKEFIIQEYLRGALDVGELAADAKGAFHKDEDITGAIVSELNVTKMNHEFELTADHLVRLAQDVLEGGLDLDALDAICFCLEASDHFVYNMETKDGAAVANALFWLGTPEVNYPLTEAVLRKIIHFLVTGEDTFSAVDLRPDDQRPDLLSVNRVQGEV
jgi:hypothetical protein